MNAFFLTMFDFDILKAKRSEFQRFHRATSRDSSIFHACVARTFCQRLVAMSPDEIAGLWTLLKRAWWQTTLNKLSFSWYRIRPSVQIFYLSDPRPPRFLSSLKMKTTSVWPIFRPTDCFWYSFWTEEAFITFRLGVCSFSDWQIICV